jgi:hypothetical protein
MTTTTATVLTRAEAAYAHLASFQLGDSVEVQGREISFPAVVMTPQQHDHADVNRCHLVVSSNGTEVWITVGLLLAGQHTITLASERASVRYFDAARYWVQNRDELQARIDAEMRERAYNEAHYLSNASAYFPGDHP